MDNAMNMQERTRRKAGSLGRSGYQDSGGWWLEDSTLFPRRPPLDEGEVAQSHPFAPTASGKERAAFAGSPLGSPAKNGACSLL